MIALLVKPLLALLVKPLLAFLALLVVVFGGYQTLRDSPRRALCDVVALVGLGARSWCGETEQASADTDLLAMITFLEAQAELTESQRTTLVNLKTKLIERALASIASAAEREGIAVEAEAAQAASEAAAAVVEEGDASERAALVRIAEGDVAGGLDALAAAAAAATDDAIVRWRNVAALAYEVDTDRARAAYARVMALGSIEPWDAIFLSRLHRRAGDLGAAAATIQGAYPILAPSDERARLAFKNEIGDVRRAQGNLEAALEAYQDGLAIARTLTERDPANAEWRRDMAMSLSHLVTLEGAGVSWDEVADAWEAMLRDGVLAPVDRPYLEEVRQLAGRRGD